MQGPGMFKAEAKSPIDVVVRRHDYLAGGTTGWHAHPYPVLITVITGTLTFYEYDDPTCTPVVVSAARGTSTPVTDTSGGTRLANPPPISA